MNESEFDGTLRAMTTPIAMDPTAMDRHAAAELRFIRTTMERAVRFDAVPGIGMVLMGTGAVAAYGAARLMPDMWLTIWLTTAVAAFITGVTAMALKARRGGLSIWSRPAQSFVVTFIPPLVVGALLTGALDAAGAHHLMPGAWLSLYGIAALTGGAFSVRSVAIMGIGFLLLGAAALLYPPAGPVLMVCGFGVLHVAFGAHIANRHGG